MDPFLCFGKISAALECYLNSCFLVPSRGGEKLETRRDARSDTAGAVGTVGKGSRRVPARGTNCWAAPGEGLPLARAHGRDPGAAITVVHLGTGRPQEPVGRSSPGLRARAPCPRSSGTGERRSPTCGPGAVARQPSTPARQWAPCSRGPTLPAGELLCSLKIWASAQRGPVCRWPRHWLLPRHLRVRSHERLGHGLPCLRTLCRRPESFWDGQTTDRVGVGVPEVSLLGLVPQGPASRLRLPSIQTRWVFLGLRSGAPRGTLNRVFLARTAVESHSKNGKLQRQQRGVPRCLENLK